MKSTMQRITVRIPTVLLHRACAITGEGITSTVRQGLRLITAVNSLWTKSRGIRAAMHPG